MHSDEKRSVPRMDLSAVLVWAAMATPAIVFYALLSRSLTGLPFADDYGAVLGFALKWHQSGTLGRLGEIVSFQHNEYRLMLENLIMSGQLSLLGHVNLKLLAVMGDLFVIPIFVALCLIWHGFGHRGGAALAMLVPASWIVFNLQYASTLNFAMGGLQNVPVICFMLFSCWFLPRPGRRSFTGAVATLILCIASSGNGFFMIPVGGLMLVQQRHLRRLALWIAVGAVMCAVYFFRFDFHASQKQSVQHLSFAYGAAFLGSNATVSRPLPAILFCVILLAIFIMATWDRLYLRNPALYYAALFFLVTAIAVSGIRSENGLITALGSRYRINSTVFVALIYFFLADKALRLHMARTARIAVACLAAVLLVIFTGESDRGGDRLLLMRRERLREAMVRWERHEPPPPVAALGPDDFTLQHEKQGLYEPDPLVLQAALQTGVYRLPQPVERN